VGLARIRRFRPFPAQEFIAAVKGAKQIAVVDRAMSHSGLGNGQLVMDVKSVLYDQPVRPYIWDFVAGLSGRDVSVENFVEMADGVEAAAADKLPQGATWINVRE
jgi:pyruvate ferredoxin oxidoreductase alpha subunit